MKIVEDTVGARIFRRTRTGVAPTDVGLRLVAEGRAIIEHTQAAQQAVEQWKSGLTAPLRIGTGPMLANIFLDKVMVRAVVEPWPYLTSVLVRPVGQLMEELSNGKLDVVLAPDKPAISTEGLHCSLLFQQELAVFGSKDDPFVSAGAPVEASQLSGPWVDFALLTGLLHSTNDLLEAIGLANAVPAIRIAGDIRIGARIVRELSGYCFFPRQAADRLLADWGLAPLPIEVNAPALGTAFWTNARDQDNPTIRHFRKKIEKFSDAAGFR